MTVTAPATDVANAAQTVVDTAAATLQGMTPVLLQAIAAASATSNPQMAAAVFAAQVLEYLIQAKQAGATQILQMYQALGPQIATQEAIIDAEAQARGVA